VSGPAGASTIRAGVRFRTVEEPGPVPSPPQATVRESTEISNGAQQRKPLIGSNRKGTSERKKTV
jgi:hypothetical protein